MIGLKKERLTLKKKERLMLIIMGFVFGLKFLLVIVLYCKWQIKYLNIFREKSKIQPMSFNLGNDKIGRAHV